VLAAISADGRFVAFWSFASNLVPGDTNGTTDVLVRDRQTATTERVSVDSRERQATGGGGTIDTNFGRPAISADGRLVAFASSATNLVKGDKNQTVDVFVRDRVAGTTERVSLAGRRTEANAGSSGPALSPDGRFVAFTSDADNLVAGDTNFASDVFVRDRQAATTERVSVNSDEEQANASSGGAALSADGQVVAFESEGALVPEDSEFPVDVFVHDEQPSPTSLTKTGRPTWHRIRIGSLPGYRRSTGRSPCGVASCSSLPPSGWSPCSPWALRPTARAARLRPRSPGRRRCRDRAMPTPPGRRSSRSTRAKVRSASTSAGLGSTAP
jgi:Tol biopolymer transport system component